MPTRLRILLIEDHDKLREATLRMLVSRGFFAEAVECAEDVDDYTSATVVDLYIIDLNLPGEDGLHLARRLRRAQPHCGIIIVTARSDLTDRVAGYEGGADIYLSKPVEPEELLSAIGAIARRLESYKIVSPVKLVSDSSMVLTASGQCRVTADEFSLLVAFARASDGSLERWQVAVHLKLDEGDGQSNTMNSRLSKLRSKLAKAGVKEPAIVPIRAFGYRLGFELCVS